jgi:hypothetical protein
MTTMQRTRAGGIAKSLAPMAFAAAFLLNICWGSTQSLAADFPQAQITNGQITAGFYLPNAKDGYYRSTRFDWSGAFKSLDYKGHSFVEPWYDAVDPTVINFVFRGGQVVNGLCGALEGPVYEFEKPLGWDNAQPGGTFIKIGVGVLRKTGETYNRFYPYQVLNPGKWTVKAHKSSIEFQQVLTDPALGYAYVYRKVVRLTKGKPEMVIESSLKNTGRLEIKSDVYAHNFTTIDHQPPGPDYTVTLPFQIEPVRPPNENLVAVRGNEIHFKKVLSGQEQGVVLIRGFSNSPSDNRVAIEDKGAGAGVRVSNNRPLIRELMWSIRTVVAVEPYIAIDVQPGAQFTWENTYDYYTLPAGQ